MDISLKKEFALFFIAALLAGCATTSGILPKEQKEAIPSEANLVIVHSSVSPDSITEAYETKLEEEGFSFAHRGDRSLETHSESIGEQTHLKVEAEARSTSEGSELLLRGMWGRPSTAVGALAAKDGGTVTADKRAYWVERGSPGRAFAFLVLTANDLPGELEYKEEDT